jgi:hypothetical protein
MARIVNDNMVVEVGAQNAGAFGDLITAENTPILQMDFVSGLNIQTSTYSVAGTGAVVEINTGRLRLRSGTDTSATSEFRSLKVARYRAGQGMVARFTATFTTGVSNTTQICGVGSTSDGYFFGFNGTAFGILHRNKSVDTWIPQTSWNGDKADGTGPTDFNLNKTFGNVYQIKYPYLGYGNITFWCQDTETSKWLLLHTIKYANTSSSTQLGNPNFYFYTAINKTNNATNLTILCGSVGVFITGQRNFVGNPKWAMDNNKSAITTETNIITIKNATTYNGGSNRGMIRLNSISFGSSAASGIAVIRIKKGVTLGGSPSYTTINGTTANGGVTITSGNSVASYDTAGTTVTGGVYIYSITIDNPGSGNVNLEPYDIFVEPGEILTISGFSTVSSQIGVAVNWTEDI